MSVKKKLIEVGDAIYDLLPHGARNQLAEKYGKSAKNIPKMIRGKTGSEENCKAIALDALQIIIDHAPEAIEAKEAAEAILKELERASDKEAVKATINVAKAAS